MAPRPAQSVTSAPENLREEQSARIKKYLITMAIRTACFLLAVILEGWMRWTVELDHVRELSDRSTYLSISGWTSTGQGLGSGLVIQPATHEIEKHNLHNRFPVRESQGQQ